MIWAAESAKFGLVESVVGLTPAMGGTQRVAERAGPARAREFVMTGGLYDAATLERWNVVNRVLPDGELEEKTMAFAERLAAGPDAGARGHQARSCGRSLDEGVPRRGRADSGESRRRCSTPRTCRTPSQTFLDEGPGKATFKGR